MDAQETLRVGGQAGFLPYLPTATLLHSAMGAPPGMEARRLTDMDTLRFDAALLPEPQYEKIYGMGSCATCHHDVLFV